VGDSHERPCPGRCSAGESWETGKTHVVLLITQRQLDAVCDTHSRRQRVGSHNPPLAVGAYILAWGTMGGPYEGASMNPARSFGPDLAIANLSTWWVYLVGPAAGAVLAVSTAYVLRGPAKVQEAAAAGTPLDRGT
jgi:glycerol uptake facilitator-like aquaporin